MGAVNVTPDSFSDGGRFFDLESAVTEAIRMVADGADILDIGGESTRPGALPVPADEERDRVIPVIKRLSAEVPATPISIDTRKAEVAAAGIDAGATIVNDVTGGRDPDMFPLVAGSGAGMILMHMRGEPHTMTALTDYDDVVEAVERWLGDRLEAAASAAIDRERLAVDPGLGFAKTTPQSLLLMREVERFAELGRPVVVGPSRKSFVGHATATEVGDRLEGTAGAVAWLAAHGAHVLRVHDVKEMVRVVRMVDAIRRSDVEEPAS
jgi:dihydropteroate synthase